MRLTDEIDDARTVVRNLRYVHEHATDSAELGKAVGNLSTESNQKSVYTLWWAVWTIVVHSTSAGVLFQSAVGMCGR
jgi:hypothetical protein